MRDATALASAVRNMATRAGVRDAFAWVERSEAALAAETIRVAEIPAPTFHEGARAAWVAERLRALGLKCVEVAADGNVYGLVAGRASGAALAVFAHLDTVFGPNVPVAVERRGGRLYAPGIGDNAAGVAGVLGALAALREARLVPEHGVWVVATVGEEGLGNLRGARAATDRLADECGMIVAVEGSFYGRLSHAAVGSRRWRVETRAVGGHSWHDYGKPSAVHALLRAGAAIANLQPPNEPRTTLNIGEVRGGTGVNVIAEQAEMVLDMRSVDAAQLDRLGGRVRQALEAVSGNGISVTITEVGSRPAGTISIGHPLVQTCAAVLQHLGVSPVYAAASTDANVPLGRGIPAVTLGVTRGGGAHTVGEWIESAPMVRGVQQLVLMFAALTDPAITPVGARA